MCAYVVARHTSPLIATPRGALTFIASGLTRVRPGDERMVGAWWAKGVCMVSGWLVHGRRMVNEAFADGKRMMWW